MKLQRVALELLLLTVLACIATAVAAAIGMDHIILMVLLTVALMVMTAVAQISHHVSVRTVKGKGRRRP